MGWNSCSKVLPSRNFITMYPSGWRSSWATQSGMPSNQPIFRYWPLQIRPGQRCMPRQMEFKGIGQSSENEKRLDLQVCLDGNRVIPCSYSWQGRTAATTIKRRCSIPASFMNTLEPEYNGRNFAYMDIFSIKMFHENILFIFRFTLV